MEQSTVIVIDKHPFQVKTSFHIRFNTIQTICQQGYMIPKAISVVFIDFVSLWYGKIIRQGNILLQQDNYNDTRR